MKSSRLLYVLLTVMLLFGSVPFAVTAESVRPIDEGAPLAARLELPIQMDAGDVRSAVNQGFSGSSVDRTVSSPTWPRLSQMRTRRFGWPLFRLIH